LCHKGKRFSALCTVTRPFAPSRAHSAPILVATSAHPLLDHAESTSGHRRQEKRSAHCPSLDMSSEIPAGRRAVRRNAARAGGGSKHGDGDRGSPRRPPGRYLEQLRRNRLVHGDRRRCFVRLRRSTGRHQYRVGGAASAWSRSWPEAEAPCHWSGVAGCRSLGCRAHRFGDAWGHIGCVIEPGFDRCCWSTSSRRCFQS
jgi:hypothetical protein